jgi:hypothetical protein
MRKYLIVKDIIKGNYFVTVFSLQPVYLPGSYIFTFYVLAEWRKSMLAMASRTA